jgi:hypothetical protein
MRRSLLAVRSEKVRQQPRCPSAQSIEPGMQDFRGQATLTYFVERVITANDSLQNCDFQLVVRPPIAANISIQFPTARSWLKILLEEHLLGTGYDAGCNKWCNDSFTYE